MPRVNFIPDNLKDRADADMPLPVGFGQTNSQPTTVRLMLQWLKVQPSHKVLDVGSGSGWTSALLSYLVGPKGFVYAVEAIEQLVELGRQNCQSLGIKNVKFFKAGQKYGLPKFAPYDRILVSAAAKGVPPELLSQLKTGGKMVIPVNSDVLEIFKSGKEDYKVLTHPGFSFVPLVGVI